MLIILTESIKTRNSKMSDITAENAKQQLCYWYFICDYRRKDVNGRTEFENVWNSLRGIHRKEPGLFPKNPEIIGVSGIVCSTSEAKMRSAAEYLRNQVCLPFCIHGYPIPKTPAPKYLHTVGGEFYRLFEHGWKIDRSGTPKNSLGADESRLSLVQPCPVAHSTALEEMVLPSQEFNKEFVFFPSSVEAIEKASQEEGGKWMLHSPGCMNIHDSYWLKLINLCQQGILVGVKASTAVVKECDECDLGPFSRMDPVIMCYTADSKDIGQVGRAADAIRKVVECEYVLYYKTNSASKSGKYTHEGSKRVSMYMHTVEGELYARDKMRRWKWVKY